MDFKVGDDIVCVQTHSQGFVKKDELFVAKDLLRITCCGFDVVDIGRSNPSGCSVCYCGKEFTTNVGWIDARLFKKLDDLFNEEINELVNENILIEE